MSTTLWSPFPIGWSAKNIPPLSNKVALVTGGNSGIGYNVAKQLALHGADVVIASRNDEKSKSTVDDIKRWDSDAKIRYMHLDLGDFRYVANFAKKFKQDNPSLHLLVNNAGVFQPGPYSTQADGIEKTLAINYFGHFYLTLLLLDNLTASAPSRIVTTASATELTGWLDFDNLKGQKYQDSGWTPYSTSKLMLLMFMKELQDRLRNADSPNARRIDCFCTWPGGVRSPLMNKMYFNYWSAVLTKWVINLAGTTPEVGAKSSLYAATEPDLEGRGFQFFGPYYPLNLFQTATLAPVNPTFYDPDKRRRLFEESIQLLEEVVPEKGLSRMLDEALTGRSGTRQQRTTLVGR